MYKNKYNLKKPLFLIVVIIGLLFSKQGFSQCDIDCIR
jgi:hypothetical protein